MEDLLSTDIVRNISIPGDVVPNIIDQAAASWSGALFPSNDSLYIYGAGISPLFGGAKPDRQTLHTLASYDVSKDQWFSVTPVGGDFNSDARVWGAVASDPVNGTSFFTGGANNVRGMLTFDASDPDHISWTNLTQGRTINDQNPHVIAGGMVYLPFGNAGVLLLLGGADVRVIAPDRESPLTIAQPTIFANQTFTPKWMRDNKWSMIPMDIVHVYDIETNTWLVLLPAKSIPYEHRHLTSHKVPSHGQQ